MRFSCVVLVNNVNNDQNEKHYQISFNQINLLKEDKND